MGVPRVSVQIFVQGHFVWAPPYRRPNAMPLRVPSTGPTTLKTASAVLPVLKQGVSTILFIKVIFAMIFNVSVLF